MGLMTTTPLCQIFSFTIWFHKASRVSVLNGCLVSVGPAGSVSEECTHTKPALLQRQLCHWEAGPCWGLLQDVALAVFCFFGSIMFQWEQLSCPPKVLLIMIRPVLRSLCNRFEQLSPVWLSCIVQPSELGAGPPNLFLNINFIIIIFLLALPFQAVGEAVIPHLPGEG